MGQALASLAGLGDGHSGGRERRAKSRSSRRSTVSDDRERKGKHHQRHQQRTHTYERRRRRGEHDRGRRHSKQADDSTLYASEAATDRVRNLGTQSEATSYRPRRDRERAPKAEPRHRQRNEGTGVRQSRSTHSPSYVPPLNRYHHLSKSESGVQTGVAERRPRISKQRKECIVCAESLSMKRFPTRAPTAQCTHEANTCRHCLRTWIRSEFEIKMWDQLDCPECKARMGYEDMKEFAPGKIFRQ